MLATAAATVYAFSPALVHALARAKREERPDDRPSSAVTTNLPLATSDMAPEPVAVSSASVAEVNERSPVEPCAALMATTPVEPRYALPPPPAKKREPPPPELCPKNTSLVGVEI